MSKIQALESHIDEKTKELNGMIEGGAMNFFYPKLRTNKYKLFFNIHH